MINKIKIGAVLVIWLLGAFPQELAPFSLMLVKDFTFWYSFTFTFVVIALLYVIQFLLLLDLFQRQVPDMYFNKISQRLRQSQTPFYLKGFKLINTLVDDFQRSVSSSSWLKKVLVLTTFGFLPFGLTFFAAANAAFLGIRFAIIPLLAGVGANIMAATILGYMGVNYPFYLVIGTLFLLFLFVTRKHWATVLVK